MFDTGKTKADIDLIKEKAEAEARLAEIDRESIRSIRAILSADKPDQKDIDKLKSLEDEAKVKREKLK